MWYFCQKLSDVNQNKCALLWFPPSPNSGIIRYDPNQKDSRIYGKVKSRKRADFRLDMSFFIRLSLSLFYQIDLFLLFLQTNFKILYFSLFLLRKKNSWASPYSSCRVFHKTVLVLPSRAKAQWEDNLCYKCHWLEVDVEVLFGNASFKIPLHVWGMQSRFPECYLWVILYFLLLFLLRICYTCYYIDIYD